MWLDDCRIPFVDEGDLKSQERAFTEGSSSHKGQAWNNHLGWESSSKGAANPTNIKGRFTPNLLVCDDLLNDGMKTNKGHRAKSKVSGYGEFGGGKSEYHGIGEYMEVDSKSRYYDLDTWFDKIIEGL